MKKPPKLVNKTPFPIDLVDKDDFVFGTLAACSKEDLIQIPAETGSGESIGLPLFQEGILYIVSPLIKSALPDRVDLLDPEDLDSNWILDERGQLVGCSLIQFWCRYRGVGWL